MAYDPVLNLIYIGVGNGTPWNRAKIQGDGLYLSSIVALKADTGEYAWHYQTTPGDEWDFDACSPLILADLAIGGAKRSVLMQAPKNGFFYVLDRATGELLSADAFAITNWAKRVDLKTGRPIIESAARYGESGKPFVAMPGPGGAHSWQPMSFSPLTGLVYLPVTEAGFPFIPESGATQHHAGLEHGGRFQCGKPAPGSENQGADQERSEGSSRGLGSRRAQRSVARGTGDSLEWRRRFDGGQSGVPGYGHGRVRRLPR
jgi:quinohemoprotein ethanol dehydrogenase